LFSRRIRLEYDKNAMEDCFRRKSYLAKDGALLVVEASAPS